MSALGSWLRPPAFEDEEQAHQAYMLHVILWALAVVGVLYVLLTVLVMPDRLGSAVLEGGSGLAASAILLLLLHKRQLALACSLQVLAFFTFFTVLAAQKGGVLSPAYLLGYGLTIVIAGVLLGGRGALAVTAAAILAGGVLTARGAAGSVADERSPVFVWGLSALMFPMTALVQNLSARTVQGALARARSSEARYRELVAELEAKNAELERFTYTVSHDLKSPLFTLRGFLDYMARDALSGNLERLRGDISRSTAAADKMRRLLDDLLELSRIGRIVNPAEDFAFGDVVREAVGLARGRLEARGVRVVVAEGLPVVRGDRQRLVEVVQNLVDNAAKFTGDAAEPRIEIGVREDQGEAVFFVRDNGVGIAPQHRERVFRLFDKLEPDSEGTGVGLALVKRIVELHGGRVWVESSGPSGATFCFTLGHERAPAA